MHVDEVRRRLGRPEWLLIVWGGEESRLRERMKCTKCFGDERQALRSLHVIPAHIGLDKAPIHRPPSRILTHNDPHSIWAQGHCSS